MDIINIKCDTNNKYKYIVYSLLGILFIYGLLIITGLFTTYIFGYDISNGCKHNACPNYNITLNNFKTYMEDSPPAYCYDDRGVGLFVRCPTLGILLGYPTAGLLFMLICMIIKGYVQCKQSCNDYEESKTLTEEHSMDYGSVPSNNDAYEEISI